ncbi:MAG: hypothetical protein K2X47_05555, partial [Bdellovibrionales bacterium]|nr:hypothetical protein [Bdellovibrionales bacterium]
MKREFPFDKILMGLVVLGIAFLGLGLWKKFGSLLDPQVRAIRKVCESDVSSKCATARTGAALRACLSDNFMDIGADCKALVEPCFPYYKTHCAGRARAEIGTCIAELPKEVLSPE